MPKLFMTVVMMMIEQVMTAIPPFLHALTVVL